MAVNFPDNPSNGQTVTFGSTTYTYNSTKGIWTSGSSSSTNTDSYLEVANSVVFVTKADAVASNNAIKVLIDDRLQVANLQPQLDKYLQVANSTSFATSTQLDAYLQVANSTTFATTTQLDAYLQVANSTSFATTSQLGAYLQVANSASLGSGNTSLTQSDTPPGSPSVGDLWFDTSDPKLYVYYSDGSSNQWVQTNPAGSGGSSSSSSSASTGTIIALNYFFGG